jgi:hypothetical protein
VKKIAISVVVGCVLALAPLLASAASTALSSVPTCTHLAVAATTVEGADGVGSTTIILVNVGGRCDLFGYPVVQFFEPKFSHLVGHDLHRSTMVFASPTPKRVALAHDGVASVGVSWSDDPQPHQICSRTQWANVVMPSSGQLNFQPSLNAVPCGTDVWVTPIEAGARPTIS